VFPPQFTEIILLGTIGALEIRRATSIEFNDHSQRWGVRGAKDYGLLFQDASREVFIKWELEDLLKDLLVAAKATASVFGVPLLRLDAGKLFWSLVGQSEGDLRCAIATAEAISPCVMWIDEIEKGFAGSKSSASSDGGTSARVLGSFLNWMQEKSSMFFAENCWLGIRGLI
jgi:ATPase family associated with various cellular activities (AAA)